MNENQAVRVWSLLALGAAAVSPLAVACAGNSTPPPAVPPQASAGATYGQPSQPGYPGAPPPGYPGAPAPTQTYPTAQAGYPAAPAPGPTYAAPPQPTTYAPAAGQAPSAAPTTPLAPTDPNSLQGILNGLQGALQGTLVAPGAGGLPTDLTEAGLKAQALRLAPGMQPEGPELKQSLTEAQHAVEMVTLQAGKCYTIIGFSALGAVKDLDLNLLAPPLYLTLAGQDLTHNNAPVIGGAPSPMCPVIAFPLQYKLDVYARSGAGLVAVQLYSKNK